MKKCPKCKKVKRIDDFYNDKTQKTGKSVQCRECNVKGTRQYYKDNRGHILRKRKKGYAAIKVQKAKYRKENKEKCKQSARNTNYYRKFGIRIKDYDEMYERQSGVCAICGKKEDAIYRGVAKNLAIDHDHVTGVVRGLLCAKCNTALGNVNDDIGILVNMIEYLKMES